MDRNWTIVPSSNVIKFDLECDQNTILTELLFSLNPQILSRSSKNIFRKWLVKFYLWSEEYKIFSSRVWERSESRFLEAAFRKPSCQGRNTVLTSQSREIRLSRQDKGPPRSLSRTVATDLPVTATWKYFPLKVRAMSFALIHVKLFYAWNIENESEGKHVSLPDDPDRYESN